MVLVANCHWCGSGHCRSAVDGCLLIAYISFGSHAEMFQHRAVGGADRAGIFAAYLAIPVQYFPGLAFLF